MFSKEDIKKQLETFKIAKGKIVTMHTSLKAIGEVEGRAEGLLEVLIEYFTDNGGLFTVPTHTWNSTVYDMRENETCLGTFPKIAAGFKGGVRTEHPTHSMVVFGDEKKVLKFVEYEKSVNSPTNPKGCYGKIFDEGGYVLLVGVGHNKNTFLHCVEEILGIKKRLTKDMVERTIIHKNGKEEKRYMYWLDQSKIHDVSVFYGKFEAAFRHYGCIVDGFIGNAPTQLCNARKMKEVAGLIYKNCGGKEFLADHKPLDEKWYINKD